MKEAIFVAFGNQKGGIGKSTMCRLIATHLWYTHPEIKIALWDCDNPQFSNARLRAMDLELWDKMPVEKKEFRIIVEQFEAQRRKAALYPIKEMDVARIEREGNDDIEQYDIILIDLPGTIDSQELATVLPFINYLFLPTDYDNATVDSTIRYLKVLEGIARENQFPVIGNMYLFFNGIKKAQLKNIIEKVKEDVLRNNPEVKFLSHSVLRRENIKDDNLSTMARLSEVKVDNEHFYVFVKELLSIVKLNVNKLKKV